MVQAQHWWATKPLCCVSQWTNILPSGQHQKTLRGRNKSCKQSAFVWSHKEYLIKVCVWWEESCFSFSHQQGWNLLQSTETNWWTDCGSTQNFQAAVLNPASGTKSKECTSQKYPHCAHTDGKTPTIKSSTIEIQTCKQIKALWIIL